MVQIKALVTSTNNLIIDPGVKINSDNINGYEVCFEFQAPWDAGFTLYAVVKPIFDVPVKIAIGEDNSAILPAIAYKKYSKVGIGLRGEITDALGNITQVISTALRYVEVVKGA